jgi:hypothetical protein
MELASVTFLAPIVLKSLIFFGKKKRSPDVNTHIGDIHNMK